MAQLFNQLTQILTGGIGGVTFLGTWTYLVWRWLQNSDFAGFGLNTIKIPIPWLW